MITDSELFAVIGRDKAFCPLFVSKQLGCEIEDVTDSIWFYDIKGRFVNGLWELEPKNPKWVVEICDTKYKRGEVLSPEFYWDFVLSNNKEDQHNSVFWHDHTWLEKTKKGSVSGAAGLVYAPYLILELDRKCHDVPIKKSIEDCNDIINTLNIQNYSSVWFSGNSSCHLYIDSSIFGNPYGDSAKFCGKNNFFYNLAHLVAGDVRFKNGLINSWTAHPKIVIEEAKRALGKNENLTKERQNLENIDPNIYATNSLIRQPFSKHEKSGKEKVLIEISESVKMGEPVLKPFDFPQTGAPFLLHLAVKAFHQVPEKRFHKATESESEIIKFYSQYIEFDSEDANQDGWIQGLYNPFYNDTHPSLSINIKDGRFYDFGAPDFQCGFKSIKQRIINGNIKVYND